MTKIKKKIINFENNNLHIVGYSRPCNFKIDKNKLLKNIYSLSKQPNAIPYVTSYYKKIWGFCVTNNFKKFLKKKYKRNDKFRIFINSEYNKKGYLRYGEYLIKGKSKQEILISTYICHPSMANNELSGPLVSMCLIKYFKRKKLNKSIRFIFIPETIGSIAYLSKNLDKLKKNVIGGYNLSCVGDDRSHSCMFSKNGTSPSDEALIEAYDKLKIKNYKIYSFLKRGSDERQYNSPGVDLNITSIFRSKYGEYPEYHTSLDDFNVVTLSGIKGGFDVAKTSIEILQKKIVPKNKIICEPNLGKRSLYPTLSKKNTNFNTKNYINFLQYADGSNSIEKISNKILLNRKNTLKVYNLLKSKNLIE